MRGLPPTTQILWVWLCSYADGYGQCWPSRSRLMKDMGVTSVRTVDTHLARLEKLGWIERTNHFKNNEKQANLYQLNLVTSPKDGGRANIAPVQKTTLGRANIAHRTKPIELNKEKQLSDEEIANRRKLITEKLRNRFVS